MKKFLRRLVFIIFWMSLVFLTVFYVPDKFYAHWSVGFILIFLLLILLSFRVFPSTKKEEQIKILAQEYKRQLEISDTVRQESLQMKLTCPNCENTSTYWSYLNDYRCEKCGSNLWSTKIQQEGKAYQQLFLQNETVKQYMERLSPSMKRLLKKNSLDQV